MKFRDTSIVGACGHSKTGPFRELLLFFPVADVVDPRVSRMRGERVADVQMSVSSARSTSSRHHGGDAHVVERARRIRNDASLSREDDRSSHGPRLDQ